MLHGYKKSTKLNAIVKSPFYVKACDKYELSMILEFDLKINF